MANKSILAIGHSHLVALQRAYRQFYIETSAPPQVTCTFMQLRDPVLTPNIVTQEGDRKLNELIKQRLELAIQRHNPNVIVSCMLGNEYNFLAMLNHRRRYDFYLPARLDLPTDEKAEILPVDLIEDLIRSRLESSLGFLLTEVARLAAGRMIHVPPPPPVRQTAHIEAYPGVFAKRVGRLGVSPPFFRLKMWLLTCEVQRKLCENAGVILHRLPKPVFDPDGFLAEPLLNKDPTHGNAGYGKIMLEDIAGTNFQHLVMEKTSERAPIQEFAGLSPLAAGS